MGKFVEMFKKQGGWDLVRNYWSNGVLGYALCQMILLGKSKRALEILRLGVTYKTYNKIRKKFLPVLKSFDAAYQQNRLESQKSNKVWVYWSTGMAETAPELVKKCFKSLKDNLKNKEIVLLSKYNYHEYVDIPDYIVQKYNEGKIKHVHFADLLRIELLAQHGGTWVDSTVFCMGGIIPSYMLDSDFFIFQKMKPGADGNATRLSSWFITAYSNHKFILAQQALLRSYWKKYDKAIDYFFFHHFMTMVSEYYEDDWKKIIQFPNSFPHVLLLMIFEQFDEQKWIALKDACPFQKLSYKFDEEDMRKEGTFYQYLLQD